MNRDQLLDKLAAQRRETLKEGATVDMDQEVVVERLDTALMHKEQGNEFAHAFNLGRALEHVEQNAVDYGWFEEVLSSRGLDTGIVPVAKIEVNRG